MGHRPAMCSSVTVSGVSRMLLRLPAFLLCGVLSCAAGIDCSGFVTLCWGLPAGHAYSTSNLRIIAGKPKYNWFTDMKPGDVLNKAGSHVVIFTGYNSDGTINVCEASGSKA